MRFDDRERVRVRLIIVVEKSKELLNEIRKSELKRRRSKKMSDNK